MRILLNRFSSKKSSAFRKILSAGAVSFIALNMTALLAFADATPQLTAPDLSAVHDLINKTAPVLTNFLQSGGQAEPFPQPPTVSPPTPSAGAVIAPSSQFGVVSAPATAQGIANPTNSSAAVLMPPNLPTAVLPVPSGQPTAQSTGIYSAAAVTLSGPNLQPLLDAAKTNSGFAQAFPISVTGLTGVPTVAAAVQGGKLAFTVSDGNSSYTVIWQLVHILNGVAAIVDQQSGNAYTLDPGVFDLNTIEVIANISATPSAQALPTFAFPSAVSAVPAEVAGQAPAAQQSSEVPTAVVPSEQAPAVAAPSPANATLPGQEASPATPSQPAETSQATNAGVSSGNTETITTDLTFETAGTPNAQPETGLAGANGQTAQQLSATPASPDLTAVFAANAAAIAAAQNTASVNFLTVFAAMLSVESQHGTLSTALDTWLSTKKRNPNLYTQLVSAIQSSSDLSAKVSDLFDSIRAYDVARSGSGNFYTPALRNGYPCQDRNDTDTCAQFGGGFKCVGPIAGKYVCSDGVIGSWCTEADDCRQGSCNGGSNKCD